MKNIIAKYLAHGELSDKLIKLNADCKLLLNNASKFGDDLLASLSGQQKILFEKYCYASNHYIAEENDIRFTEGFKAGILFGLQLWGCD